MPLWSWALKKALEKKREREEERREEEKREEEVIKKKLSMEDAIYIVSKYILKKEEEVKEKRERLESRKEEVIEEIARRLNVDRETADSIYSEIVYSHLGMAMLGRAPDIIPPDEDLRLLKKLVENEHYTITTVPAVDLLHFLNKLGLLDDKELRATLNKVPPSIVKNAIMSAYLASRDEREFVQRLRELADVMERAVRGGFPKTVRWDLSDVARLIEKYYKESEGISNVKVEIDGEILPDSKFIFKNIVGATLSERYLETMAQALKMMADKIQKKLEAEAAKEWVKVGGPSAVVELRSPKAVSIVLSKLEAVRDQAEWAGGVDLRALKKMLRDVEEWRRVVERGFGLVMEWERGNKEAFLEGHGGLVDVPDSGLLDHGLVGDLEVLRRCVARGLLGAGDAFRLLMMLYTVYSMTESRLREFLGEAPLHARTAGGAVLVSPSELEEEVIRPLREALRNTATLIMVRTEPPKIETAALW